MAQSYHSQAYYDAMQPHHAHASHSSNHLASNQHLQQQHHQHHHQQQQHLNLGQHQHHHLHGQNYYAATASATSTAVSRNQQAADYLAASVAADLRSASTANTTTTPTTHRQTDLLASNSWTPCSNESSASGRYQPSHYSNAALQSGQQAANSASSIINQSSPVRSASLELPTNGQQHNQLTQQQAHSSHLTIHMAQQTNNEAAVATSVTFNQSIHGQHMAAVNQPLTVNSHYQYPQQQLQDHLSSHPSLHADDASYIAQFGHHSHHQHQAQPHNNHHSQHSQHHQSAHHAQLAQQHQQHSQFHQYQQHHSHLQHAQHHIGSHAHRTLASHQRNNHTHIQQQQHQQQHPTLDTNLQHQQQQHHQHQNYNGVTAANISGLDNIAGIKLETSPAAVNNGKQHSSPTGLPRLQKSSVMSNAGSRHSTPDNLQTDKCSPTSLLQDGAKQQNMIAADAPSNNGIDSTNDNNSLSTSSTATTVGTIPSTDSNKQQQQQQQQAQNQVTNNNSSNTTGRSKRVRTSFKQNQLRTMKSWFDKNKNPDGKDLKTLAASTGLTKRVLQVWFQNARAKWRRNCAKEGIPICEIDQQTTDIIQMQHQLNYHPQSEQRLSDPACARHNANSNNYLLSRTYSSLQPVHHHLSHHNLHALPKDITTDQSQLMHMKKESSS